MKIVNLQLGEQWYMQAIQLKLIASVTYIHSIEIIYLVFLSFED